jgi:hypothetical protein
MPSTPLTDAAAAEVDAHCSSAAAAAAPAAGPPPAAVRSERAAALNSILQARRAREARWQAEQHNHFGTLQTRVDSAKFLKKAALHFRAALELCEDFVDARLNLANTLLRLLVKEDRGGDYYGVRAGKAPCADDCSDSINNGPHGEGSRFGGADGQGGFGGSSTSTTATTRQSNSVRLCQSGLPARTRVVLETCADHYRRVVRRASAGPVLPLHTGGASPQTGLEFRREAGDRERVVRENAGEAAVCSTSGQTAAAVALHNLGVVLLRLGQVRQACDSFLAAVALEPTYSDAHCNLATALRLVGAFAVESDHLSGATRGPTPAHVRDRHDMKRRVTTQQSVVPAHGFAPSQPTIKNRTSFPNEQFFHRTPRPCGELPVDSCLHCALPSPTSIVDSTAG